MKTETHPGLAAHLDMVGLVSALWGLTQEQEDHLRLDLEPDLEAMDDPAYAAVHYDDLLRTARDIIHASHGNDPDRIRKHFDAIALASVVVSDFDEEEAA